MKRALVCLLALAVSVTELVAQTTGDYRSNPASGSGLWNAAASWQTYNGATWDAAASGPTSANGTITIRSGHTISVSAGVTVDQVVIDNGGTLAIDSSITLTLNNGTGTEIIVNGTLTNHGTIAFGAVPNRTVVVSGTLNHDGTMSAVSAAKLSFLSGASYNHAFANGGIIPAATWDPNASVNITGYTSGNTDAPGGMNQQFGNFIWNAPGQDGTVILSTGANGAPTVIKGDFRVVDTGSDALIYSTDNSGWSLNIARNLQVSGGVFAFSTVDVGPGAVAVVGDITVSGTGYLQFAEEADITIDGSANLIAQDDAQIDFAVSAGTATFNLQGNFTQTGNSTVAASGGIANVNFSGTGIQTYTSSQAATGILNYTVATGSTLALPNASFLGGSGTLTVEGTLRVASTHASGAIQTGTSNGNIRVSGARTYVTGATIVYNGTSPQFIGAGHPSATGITTQISNAGGVSLAANIAINGALELVSGNLSIGARTLTLGGTITPNANSLVTAATSSLVLNGTGDMTLPITGSTTLNNFTLNRGSGTLNTVFLSNHFTIAGTFTQTNGNLDFRGWILTISGPYNRTGGTLSVNEYTGVLINGTGALGSIAFSSPAPATTPTLNTLRLERASSTLTVTGNLYLTNDLLLVSGTLTPGSLQMATGSKLTRYDAGAITATPAAETSYSLIYQTSTDFATGPELPASATALASLTNQGPAVVTLDKNAVINGVFTLSNGTFNANTHTVTLRGNFVSNALGNFVASPVIFDGTTTISGNSPATFGAATVNSGAVLNLGPAVAPATTVNFAGNINNTGTINGGLSTTVFSGNTTLKNGVNGKLLGGFNNVQITGTLALQTVTVAPNPDVDIEKITVTGNWIVSGGTFTANFSRVDLTGTSQTLITNGSSFYSLYLIGAGIVVLNEPLAVNNDLVIETGVTLDVDINNNYSLTIKDDFTVNGTFQSRLGKVLFTNGESQSILRTAGTGAVTLYDLEVNKNSNATVTVETNVTLQNSLVIKSATVFNAGASLLTLGSNVSRTAYLGQLPTGASVTGTVIVQRFLPNAAGKRAYRYLSSPVTNAFVSDWKAEIPITGKFSDPSTGAGIVSSSASMFYYDESFTTGGTTLESRYRNYPASGLSSAAPLKPALGYSVYVRSTGTPVIDTRGTLGQGNVSIPVTARSAGGEDGWNLVGNPYPSAIDWDNVTIPAGLNNAIYFTDNADNGGTGAGNMISYVAGVGTGSYDGLIAQGQAFFVRATANTTLTFKEADKVAGQAQFFRQGEIPNVLRVTMDGQGLHDEAVLRLHEKATDAFDERYDAYKWPNTSAFNMATIATDNAKLAINAVSNLDCNKSIPISIEGAVNGIYTLNFAGLTSFDDKVNLFLLDAQENKTINLRETSQYAVTVTNDNRASLTSRFSIILGKPEANLALAAAGEQVCITAETAQVTLRNAEVGVWYAVQHAGEATEFVAGTGRDLQLTVPVKTLAEGDNELIILAKSSSCAILPLSQKPVITVVKTLVAGVEEGNSCHAGTVTLHAEAPDAAGFRWYEDLHSTSAIVGATGADFVTPVLKKTQTYYVSALNALGCEGERVAVKANVVIFDDVTLGIEGTTFTSSYGAGNQWYLDGKLIENATSATLTALASGTYTVAVAVKGCTTSASREMTILGEVGATEEYTLFPNPTADKVKLAIRTAHPVRVSLVSASGIELANIALNNAGDKKEGEIDLTAYPIGVYILRIDDGEKLLTKKVTKIK